MTNETSREVEEAKKRSLRRYRNNLACITRLSEKLTILENRILSVKTTNYSGMPKGGVPVTLADLMADKDDLEDRIRRLKVKGQKLKRDVIDEIDTLEDPRYCEILEAHFIEGLSLEDIGDRMGYTERHIYKLYQRAISIISAERL